ncbi:hypothetical protein E2C01_038934 [Portunus trituberculatus]|uniref:Uncharacterized protein n=1 Tax=Portunus trituberculatus TaxID=210409 RepID=A0A5B7FC93_PORTR|nr:hypothetical protein [Portunus trituberculatus]
MCIVYNPASESSTGKGTKNVPSSDSFRDDYPKCFDTSLNFFYINFCNIRGLRSNFQSVEHHVSSTKGLFTRSDFGSVTAKSMEVH